MIRRIQIRNFIPLLLCIGLLTVFAQRAEAFGNPDLSFGTMGTKTDFGLDYEPMAMARQPDGKIVAVGRRYESGIWELVVRRYLADGNIDTAFGWNGRAISYDIGGWGTDVAIQPDGKIAVVGAAPPVSSPNWTAVWRFNSDGWYDTSFGNSGRVMTYGEGNCDIAAYRPSRLAMVELIVGCGGGELFRLKSNGTVNMSFGSGGMIDVGGIFAMAVRSGNIYILNGQTIGKLTMSGVFDQTFGSGGVFSQQADYSCVDDFPVPGWYQSLAFQSDGTIIVAGFAEFPYYFPVTPHLSAHLANGSFKSSFAHVPCPSSNFNSVSSYQTVRVDAANRIVTGAANRVERRLADGTFEGSYSLSNQTIMDIEVLSDSRILTLGMKGINGKAYAELTQKLP